MAQASKLEKRIRGKAHEPRNLEKRVRCRYTGGSPQRRIHSSMNSGIDSLFEVGKTNDLFSRFVKKWPLTLKWVGAILGAEN